MYTEIIHESVKIVQHKWLRIEKGAEILDSKLKDWLHQQNKRMFCSDCYSLKVHFVIMSNNLRQKGMRTTVSLLIHGATTRYMIDLTHYKQAHN